MNIKAFTAFTLFILSFGVYANPNGLKTFVCHMQDGRVVIQRENGAELHTPGFSRPVIFSSASFNDRRPTGWHSFDKDQVKMYIVKYYGNSRQPYHPASGIKSEIQFRDFSRGGRDEDLIIVKAICRFPERNDRN